MGRVSLCNETTPSILRRVNTVPKAEAACSGGLGNTSWRAILRRHWRAAVDRDHPVRFRLEARRPGRPSKNGSPSLRDGNTMGGGTGTHEGPDSPKLVRAEISPFRQRRACVRGHRARGSGGGMRADVRLLRRFGASGEFMRSAAAVRCRESKVGAYATCGPRTKKRMSPEETEQPCGEWNCVTRGVIRSLAATCTVSGLNDATRCTDVAPC